MQRCSRTVGDAVAIAASTMMSYTDMPDIVGSPVGGSASGQKGTGRIWDRQLRGAVATTGQLGHSSGNP